MVPKFSSLQREHFVALCKSAACFLLEFFAACAGHTLGLLKLQCGFTTNDYIPNDETKEILGKAAWRESRCYPPTNVTSLNPSKSLQHLDSELTVAISPANDIKEWAEKKSA